ncbi:hypothetical protein K8T06_15655, partial [bacterium]|nr:hypothetical protein [bacterium]
DLNGELTAGDAQLAFQIALMMYTPSYEEECAADCNGDSEVTAGDAQGIFMAVLGTGSCVDPLPVNIVAAELIQQYLNPGQLMNENADVLWVENISAYAGEMVTVDVWIDNPMTTIDVFTLNVGYDFDALSLTDVRIGGLNPDWLEFGWNETIDGIVTIAAYNSGMDFEISSGSNGTLVEMTFKVNFDVMNTGVTLLSVHDDLADFVLR